MASSSTEPPLEPPRKEMRDGMLAGGIVALVLGSGMVAGRSALLVEVELSVRRRSRRDARVHRIPEAP